MNRRGALGLLAGLVVGPRVAGAVLRPEVDPATRFRAYLEALAKTTPYSGTIFGHPVVLSDAVPVDGAYLIPPDFAADVVDALRSGELVDPFTGLPYALVDVSRPR